jgi:hypothetical protein
MAPNKPVTEKTQSTFTMACRVRCTIRASPERIWGLLTDAPGFASWNSTVTRIGGVIGPGQKLVLEVPSAPGRVFKPTVSAFESGRTMTWSDGMAPMFKGVRTFALTPIGDGSTEFSMAERFEGLMLPMIRRSLPDFGPIFEKYAEDLRHAAEGRAASN